MHGVYVERRKLRGSRTVSKDIADHMYTRLYEGKVIVLTDRPSELMGAVKKRWHAIERQLRREHSRTLDSIRKMELTREIAHMGNRQFSTKPEHYGTGAVTTFAPGRQAFELPAACHTLYIACPINDSALELLARWVFGHGLVVVYGQEGDG